jgi:hypothetical protein
MVFLGIFSFVSANQFGNNGHHYANMSIAAKGKRLNLTMENILI